jgi:hypothetical protein
MAGSRLFCFSGTQPDVRLGTSKPQKCDFHHTAVLRNLREETQVNGGAVMTKLFASDLPWMVLFSSLPVLFLLTSVVVPA